LSNQHAAPSDHRTPQRPAHNAVIAIAGLHIAKRFGHVQALSDANVTVRAGEVVALFGDNGAGKSTFLKTLIGMVKPDAGEFIVADKHVSFSTIRDAQKAGIECVHQDLALAPDLSVVDNMFLGNEKLSRGLLGKIGVLDRKDMTERADHALRELSIKLPSLKVDISALSGGQKQALAVARAVMWGHTAILMDEPTAALGARQSAIVCDLMRTVAERGLGVLVVSHDLPRVLKIADRVTVLWRGITALDAPASELTIPEVVATMVGNGRDNAA
jgi:simple sugar transport system ATP-binding protein